MSQNLSRRFFHEESLQLVSRFGRVHPDWVIRALRAHDALPPAVKGSRGGSGADAWRDESDEDDDEDQEPLDEVMLREMAWERLG